MSSNDTKQGLQAYAKGPPDFVLGDDPELFLKRFLRFTASAKCDKASFLGLFTSYLDDRSYRRFDQIVFGDVHKTDDVVDFTKPEVVKLIVERLRVSPKVPEKVEIKFKTQGSSETVEEFGDAIRLLGRRVYGSEAEGTQEVVECFCGGLRDTDLAAKMLLKRFESLAAAIKYASERKDASNVKALLTQHRTAGKMRATDASLLNLECSEGSGGILEEVDAVQSTQPRVQQPAARRQNQITGPSGQQQVGQMPSSMSSVVCYNCRGIGHVRRDCTMPQQPFSDIRSQQPRRAPVICHNCGRPGHIKRFCRA